MKEIENFEYDDIDDLSLASQKSVSDDGKMKVQSSDIPVTTGETTTDQQEIVGYSEPADGTEVKNAAIYDSVMSDIYTEDYGLGNFLSRPVLIDTFDIPVGSDFTTRTLTPWKSFFEDARIKRKIDNYGYIQCKLKVRILINSSPFVYGMVGASYHALAGFVEVDSLNNSATPISQRPTIYLESQYSKGGDMEFPFFYYKNWLDLTSEADVEDMGELVFWQVAQTKPANAGLTVTPTVSVYAWAEEVRLAANTVTLSLQSKDEYGQGPVGKTASSVAKYSSSLEDIPVIGQFARATTIGASAVSSIANLFGWTNVPVIDDAAPYKSMPFHGLASSDIGNVVEKLTLDPKNELSVDPKTVGLPSQDELSISYLASKEAYIDSALWQTSDNPDTSLLRVNVTPSICDTVAATNQTILLDSPMGMISRMFAYWRGDIIIRLKIICSPYHKGRLRVSFDPVGDLFGSAESTTVIQTKIIDISENQDVSFRIPYMAKTNWLKTPIILNQQHMKNAETNTTYAPLECNGRFEVRVLNELSAPVDTADVRVAMWVRGADNLEFSNPKDIEVIDGTTQKDVSQFTIQSMDTPVDDDNCYVLGKVNPPVEDRYLINMGENVKSLRTLLRRSVYINTERGADNGAADDSATYYRMYMSKYPPFLGFDANGIHGAQQIVGATTDVGYNFTTTHPYTFISPCFVGQRGSTIWHFNVRSPEHVDSIRVRRVPRIYNAPLNRADLRQLTTNIVNSSYSNTARGGYSRGSACSGGAALINQKTQTGLSVLFPQYNEFRFVGTYPSTAVFGTSTDSTTNELAALEMVTSNKNDNTIVSYDRYFSVGTDFTLFCFMNVPPRYLQATPTAASF